MEQERTRKVKVIGTRGSNLALVQTNYVKSQIAEKFPDVDFHVQIINTKGDKILDTPLAKIGDKGLFTKELDTALMRGDIDFAVHSLKDVPTRLDEQLTIGAITARHDPLDCVVLHSKHKQLNRTISSLPEGSIIGTSSLRRIAQLKRKFPHLVFKDVRGNLNTRLAKLDEGHYDALILAKAGLERLGFYDRVDEVLDSSICLHAVGQGALGVECRSTDLDMLRLLSAIHDDSTDLMCQAERAFLREMEGGCQVPVGVRTSIEGNQLTLRGNVLSLDGQRCVEDVISGDKADAAILGTRLAQKLKLEGATEILEEVFKANHKGSVN